MTQSQFLDLLMKTGVLYTEVHNNHIINANNSKNNEHVSQPAASGTETQNAGMENIRWVKKLQVPIQCHIIRVGIMHDLAIQVHIKFVYFG